MADGYDERPPLLLFLGPQPVPARPAQISYPIRVAKYDAPSGVNRLTWRIGLFECFQAQDCGYRCCVAHCCCAPFIWNSAMKLVPGLEGEDAALAATLVANAIPQNDNGANSVIKAAAQTAANFARARVRLNLINIFYPEGFSENRGTGIFYHCCCPCCASIQETDAVMTWVGETYGQDVYYGPVGFGCGCCELYTRGGRPVRKVPYPTEPKVANNLPYPAYVIERPPLDLPLPGPPGGGRAAPAATWMGR